MTMNMVDIIMTFMAQNMANIIVVVLFLILLGMLLYKGKRDVAKRIVLSIVLLAENRFGGGNGSAKYAYVLGAIYPRLPTLVRFFVTESKLNEWIEDSVMVMKDLLADGEGQTTQVVDNQVK
jgi:hypothetical protein